MHERKISLLLDFVRASKKKENYLSRLEGSAILFEFSIRENKKEEGKNERKFDDNKFRLESDAWLEKQEESGAVVILAIVGIERCRFFPRETWERNYSLGRDPSSQRQSLTEQHG